MHATLIRLTCLLPAVGCLLGGASAETATDSMLSTLALQGVDSLFTLNDCLYVHTRNGLYRLDEQAENPMAVPLRGDARPIFRKMTAFQDNVYALGDTGAQGVLYRMSLTDDALSVSRELAVFPMPDGEDVYWDCAALVADENAAWALLSETATTSFDAVTTLYRVNLADGAVTKSSIEHLTNLCAYRDGFLLGRRWDRQAALRSSENAAPELVSIGKADFSVTALAALPDDSFSAPVYDAASDFIYASSPSRLIRLNGELQAETCAYLAWEYIADSMPALLWHDRYLLATYESGVVSASTDPALMPKQVIKVAKSSMDDMTRGFCAAQPDVAVTLADNAYFSTEEIAKQMVAASDDIDVYSLYLGFGSFRQLLQKGYCFDLSGSDVLMQTVGRMSPALSAACCTDSGALCALPFRASADGFGYSPSALKKLGLTEDDLPRTYLELMDFAVRFMDDCADNEAGLSLLDSVYDIRAQLLTLLENAYVNRAMARGETLTFDTPLYRSLLAKLREVTPPLLPLNPEDPNESTSYTIYEDNNDAPTLFTFFAQFTPHEYPDFDYVPLALTLEAGDDPVFEATVQVLFINPFSQNTDAALRYLEYCAEHIDPYNAITLFPDQNDPLEDPDYQQQTADSDKNIASAQERLAAADAEHKGASENELAFEPDWRKTLDKRRRSVSAEQIAAYRALEPYVFLNADNVFANGSVADVRSRYLSDALSDEQYIAEPERVLRMMRLESR